ncbi:MAG: SpoIVB peptidase S55 domain-containing protein [Candidatus Zhuqueibacterota bacterium]
MRHLIASLLIGCISLLHGADNFMPLKDVKPGMKGLGLTIFENNKIEQFDLEVLDIVRNYFPQRAVILVRLIGEKVTHTGVVSGMSGSPVYINDKLVGALAYRVGQFMKDPIAGVTPIEQMLDIYSKEEIRQAELAAVPHPYAEEIVNFIHSRGDDDFDFAGLLKPGPATDQQSIMPIETSIFLSGFSPDGIERFKSCSGLSDVHFMTGGKMESDQATGADGLLPGSAVAASLISGDFDISAVGTVTYCDGNRVLAFGHPMFNSGAVSLPMANARVITTLSSLMASNKYAVATDIIGAIRQDRSSGILGIVGERAPLIPVQMKVISSVSKERQFHFNLANDRSSYSMLPVFLWMTIINSLETSRLGFGDYSIRLQGSIDNDNCDDVILENLFAGAGKGFYDGSGTDVSEAAYEIVMSLSAVLMNQFEPAQIKKIDLTFNIQPGRNSARIEKVYFDRQEVAPGDPLTIFVAIRPYQGEMFELKKTIQIPGNISSQRLRIVVGGKDEITQREQMAGIYRYMPKSLAEIVSLLNRRKKNNAVFIQIKESATGAMLHGKEFPSLPPSVQTLMMNSRNQDSFDAVTEKVVREWIIPMNYDIQGGNDFVLRVADQPKN